MFDDSVHETSLYQFHFVVNFNINNVGLFQVMLTDLVKNFQGNHYVTMKGKGFVKLITLSNFNCFTLNQVP